MDMSASLHHEKVGNPAVDELVGRLGTMDLDDIRRAGFLLRAERRTAADDISWWSATIRVEHVVRREHRRVAAARSAAAASRAVRDTAAQAGLEPDDPDVVAAARAASEAAGALAAGPTAAAEAAYFLARLGPSFTVLAPAATTAAA